MKSKRSGAEFNNRIKDEERSRWHAKNPGREDADLNVHHIMPIAEGLKRGVSKDALKSQQNAVALEKDFHNKVHRETDEETLNVLAQGLRALWRTLF